MENPQSKSLCSHINCLIIDDDKFSRTFIKTVLNQIGIKNVREASNEKEAENIIKENTIHIILLDQQMPDKSGLEIAKELKSGQDTKDIPIIMITVDTKEKTVLDAKSIGIQEYLIKPVSPLALKKRISNVLNLEKK